MKPSGHARLKKAMPKPFNESLLPAGVAPFPASGFDLCE
jgi:hypothetical protein